MYQIATSPLLAPEPVFCQTRSAVPSPLTSTAPASCQFGSATASMATAVVNVVPFMNQITLLPALGPLVLRHIRSAWLSPLASPAPTSVPARSATVGTPPV